MKRHIIYPVITAIVLLILIVGAGMAQEGSGDVVADRILQPTGINAALGTAFTFQGQLVDSGAPANGDYDFTFDLYDASTGGSPAASTLSLDNVPVRDGLFTVELDFGSGVFRGLALYLELAVRPGASTGSYERLSPRQPLTATPYATHAENAPWGGLTGVPAGFADDVDNNTTYSAGPGLILSGTQFRADLTIVQARVTGTCAAGSSIRVVNADGTVTCEPDSNTTYNAGTGLYLDHGTFNLLGAYRLPQGCRSGEVAKYNALGSTWSCAVDNSGVGGSYWSLTGNLGTDPTTDYVGTSDAVTLTLAVNGITALRLVPTSSTPTLIGGPTSNTMHPGVIGGVIGGGGSNYLDGSAGVIGGGSTNTATGDAATVGGGQMNEALANYATIAGGGSYTAGEGNVVSDRWGTIGGGADNLAGDNVGTTNDANHATVSGGYRNSATGSGAFVGGGYSNLASGNYAAIAGGYDNTADDHYTAVGGGYNNNASGIYGAIGGGLDNTASNSYAAIAGGYDNTASALYATVGGGASNSATANYASAGGGTGNSATGLMATISGGGYNVAGAEYAVIGGGGGATAADGNIVTDNYGTIGGGRFNEAGDTDPDPTSAYYATVGGGWDNFASGLASTTGGGWNNAATSGYAVASGGMVNRADNTFATVSGGHGNQAYGHTSTIGGGDSNRVDGNYGTIAGGGENDPGGGNHVTDKGGTIGGGSRNQAGDDAGTALDANYATVSGGDTNVASGTYATIGGGYSSTADGLYATVGGGQSNGAAGEGATVGGGDSNSASQDRATVGGGFDNTASGLSGTVAGGESNDATNSYASIGGGYDNTAGGQYATIPGGRDNAASGSYSFAAGRRAHANNSGCFVWGDSTNADVTCSNNNRFIARASGGVYFYSNSTQTLGSYLAAGGSAWNAVSDRDRKENVTAVDTNALLEAVTELDINTWNYIEQDDAIRHIGPMAQDFNALLPELGGEGERYINSLDADGVALGAIQALAAENSSLRQNLADVEARLAALETQQPQKAQAAMGWLFWAVLLLGGVGGATFIRFRPSSNLRG